MTRPDAPADGTLRAPVYSIVRGRRVLDTGKVRIGLRAGEHSRAAPAALSLDAEHLQLALLCRTRRTRGRARKAMLRLVHRVRSVAGPLAVASIAWLLAAIAH